MDTCQIHTGGPDIKTYAHGFKNICDVYVQEKQEKYGEFQWRIVICEQKNPRIKQSNSESEELTTDTGWQSRHS